MRNKAIVASGLAVLSAGLASTASMGIQYLLDPTEGAERRRRLWKRAQDLVHDLEQSGARRELRVGAKGARLLLDHLVHRRPQKTPAYVLPVALAGAGLSLGAGLYYLFDPEHGKQRRTKLGERLVEIGRILQHDVLDKVQSSGGPAAWAQQILHTERETDEQLAGRVRTLLACVLSHPEALTISAERGTVTVSGTATLEELDKIRACTAAARGVRSIDLQLEIAQPGSSSAASMVH